VAASSATEGVWIGRYNIASGKPSIGIAPSNRENYSALINDCHKCHLLGMHVVVITGKTRFRAEKMSNRAGYADGHRNRSRIWSPTRVSQQVLGRQKHTYSSVPIEGHNDGDDTRALGMVLALPVLAIAQSSPGRLRGRPRRRAPRPRSLRGPPEDAPLSGLRSLATVPTVALAVVAPSTMTVALAVALSARRSTPSPTSWAVASSYDRGKRVPSERFTVTITTAGFDPAASCATTAHPKTSRSPGS